jgi:hypothetical protein
MTWWNTPLFQMCNCYLIARVNAEAVYRFLNWSSTWLHRHKDMTISLSTSYLMIVSVRFVILHYVDPYRQSVVDTDSVKTAWSKRSRGKFMWFPWLLPQKVLWCCWSNFSIHLAIQ